ncbi:FAD-binding oxidoreductase [Octadecabacter sp. 1_MG-2023]|uniref:FAD-binding oxidoreductase n=1 Tax=unclassified Octadecabacter TaxID=196158 RepID=UPI001C09C052|nr:MULTISPECIES: FAD-binding oxidoreductase [unclassified Octadecabacter]MBU2994251.1 FAD-binding oxidoreductase [Octadecabacter sp. B2R22]MDO6734460.1 FAD-binding oxidoreductase [Octadecabacter sp. 1_MG-2023]
MPLLQDFAAIVGDEYALTGADTARWSKDWTGKYCAEPGVVLRPASTIEVSRIMALANQERQSITPVSGHTGLVGGTYAPGGVLLSLDRMNTIHEVNTTARTATVDAGVILSSLHDAAEMQDLIFPLTFGARGSAMIGGVMSTNAGGSNVLRYGNTRDLVLGLEAVLADGRVVNLMSSLHKDNSGLNLRQLLIGSEGTLGVITKAVLKLAPKPHSYATAMVACPTLEDALTLLNRTQDATGRSVEAFEYMPRNYIDVHMERIDGAREPFDAPHDINIMVEVATTTDFDVNETLLGIMADMMEDGTVLDAVVAQNEGQRREMWDRREAAAELAFWRQPIVDTDVALPLDLVPAFFEKVAVRMAALDAGFEPNFVAHLGDGNVHYSVYPSRDDAALKDKIVEAIEDVVEELGGSFSAEHGVGLSKLNTMRRRKDPVALDMMRKIKGVLDPNGILNPGKMIPD